MESQGFPIDPETSPWSWWKSEFPTSWRIYGPPFLFGEINYDFLASSLGESCTGLIYYPPEGMFYFRDYLFENAYRPTSNGKVEALVRKLVRESVQDAPKSIKEGSKTLFDCSGRVRSRGEEILAVEAVYFSGIGANRRYLEGKFIEPDEPSSVGLFAEAKLVRKRGKVLPVALAYSHYFDFCRDNRLAPVKKSIFKEMMSEDVRKKWHLGVRNDLKVDGFSQQGWSDLAVL